MRKIFKVFCLVLIMTLMISISGCKEKNKRCLSELKTGHFTLISGVTEVSLFNGFGDNYFKMYVISKDKLSNDDIKIGMNTKCSYMYDLVETKLEELPYEIFLIYKGLDWKKLEQLEKKAKETNKEEDINKAADYYCKYEAEYEKIKKNKNDFHFYTLGIGFTCKDIINDEKIEEITLEYKDKIYKTKCNIQLYKDIKEHMEDEKIEMNSVGKWNLPMFPNKKGEIKGDLDKINFTVKENIKLNNIKVLYNESVKVDKAILEVDGVNVDFYNGMELAKGSEVGLDVEYIDEDFKNKLVSYMNMVLCIEYECVGNYHCSLLQKQYTTGLGAYEGYAYYIDKKNVLEYMTEYGYKYK